LPEILGAPINTLARDANLFLRHLDSTDRFLLFPQLERALIGEQDFQATYRWARPDTEQLRWIHCRATLNQRSNQELFEGFLVDLTEEVRSFTSTSGTTLSLKEIVSAQNNLVAVLDERCRVIETNWTKQLEVVDSIARWFNFGDPSFSPTAVQPGVMFLNAFGSIETSCKIQDICESLLSGDTTHHCYDLHIDGHNGRASFSPIYHHEAPLGVLIAVENRSEQQSLQSTLDECCRNDAILSVAAGLSDSIATSLRIIQGQALAIQTDTSKAAVEYATDTIARTANRALHLIQKVASLSSNNRNSASVDINLLLLSSIEHLHSNHSDLPLPELQLGLPPLLLQEEQQVRTVIERAFTLLSLAGRHLEKWSILTGEAEKPPAILSSAGPYGFISVVLSIQRGHKTHPLFQDTIATLEKMVDQLSGCVTLTSKGDRLQELLIHLPVVAAQ
jgi:hypothetical protein